MTLASQQKVRVKMKPNIPGIPKVSEIWKKIKLQRSFYFSHFGQNVKIFA